MLGNQIYSTLRSRDSIEVDVLVVDGKLLGFNLLLEIATIKRFGGMCVTNTRIVNFSCIDSPLRAAISFSEPDFHAVRPRQESLSSILEKDLAHSKWYESGYKLTVLVDASLFTTGVLIETNRSIIMDVSIVEQSTHQPGRAQCSVERH